MQSLDIAPAWREELLAVLRNEVAYNLISEAWNAHVRDPKIYPYNFENFRFAYGCFTSNPKYLATLVDIIIRFDLIHIGNFQDAANYRSYLSQLPPSLYVENLDRRPVKCQPCKLSHSGVNWNDVEVKIMNYLSNLDILKKVFLLCREMPYFLTDTDISPISRFFEYGGNNTFINLVRESPRAKVILLNVMLAFGFYPKDIPEADIRYLVSSNIDFTSEINSIPDVRVQAILADPGIQWLNRKPLKFREYSLLRGDLDWNRVKSRLTSYFSRKDVLKKILMLCVEVPEFNSKINVHPISQFLDLAGPLKFMPLIEGAPIAQIILCHVMLAFELYPADIPEEDIRYLAFYARINYVNAINTIPDNRVQAILQDKVDVPDMNPLDNPKVVELLTNYFIDHRLLDEYLLTCDSIQKYVPDFLARLYDIFISRVDLRMIDDFINQLKHSKLYARQFLALMLMVSHQIEDKHLKALKPYCDENVRLLCTIINDVPKVKIDDRIKHIRDVHDQYQVEKEKIKEFLRGHIKDDQVSKLYMQLWCQAPLLLNSLTRNQRESLEDMINFKMFFADNRRYCRELVYLIHIYIDKSAVADVMPFIAVTPELVSFVTFISTSEVERICTQIKSLVSKPLTDRHAFDEICNKKSPAQPLTDQRVFANVPNVFNEAELFGNVAQIVLPEAINEKKLTGDETGCTICFEHPINTVIIPCGHRAICVTCARDHVLKHKRTTCPACRVPMTHIVKLDKVFDVV